MVYSSSQKLLFLMRRCERNRIYADIHVRMQVCHKDLLAIYQFWNIRASPVMNIDFYFFAFQANMHGHAHAPRYTHTDTHTHIYTNTCALLQPKRMWLCSPLCVSPPAWQMHLLSKSWWIFSLNSKSKPHFPSPSLLREPFMSAVPAASPSNHSLTKAVMEENIALDSYLRRMLSLCDEWEQCILVYSNTSYQMRRNVLFFFAIVIVLTTFWQIVLQLHFLYLPVFLSTPSCFLFLKLPLFLFTPRSPQSTSATLFPSPLLSTASLLEWQLSEVGSILIYFMRLWIFSVNRAVSMHGCQTSCELIRGIVHLICWLTE